MILYEFVFRNQKIDVKEHEVKETAKTYSCLTGHFTYNCLSRISREYLNAVLNGGFWGISYFCTQNDIKTARKAFADYYRTTVIPNKARDIETAVKSKEDAEKQLKILEEKSD